MEMSFNDFQNLQLEYGKLYTLYYDIPDSLINNFSEFDRLTTEIINNYMYNPNIKANVKFDNNTHQLIISFYLIKDQTLGAIPLILIGGVLIGGLTTLLATWNFKPVKVVVDTLENTLTGISNVSKYLPYIIGIGAILFILSYSNTTNLKRLLK